MNTIEENLKCLSPGQKKLSKEDKDIYKLMGIPTVGDLKAITQMTLMKNNVVTTDNVNLETKYYSPDVGGIKGKTTKSRPMSVISTILEITNEFM